MTPAASVTVNGVTVISGVASGTISLAVGETEIKVVVTAEDTSTALTYTLAVTRAAEDAADDAALSGLALSAGALSPAFASDAFMYTVAVANAVTSITVTPTLNDANASVTVAGAAVVSGGEASGAINLAVGETEIKVVVTAEDAETTRTYTLAVTRAVDPTAFITTWRATANDAITFPGEGSYTIEWGDGSAIDTATGSIDHTYAAAGDYDIAASNTITRFNLNNHRG